MSRSLITARRRGPWRWEATYRLPRGGWVVEYGRTRWGARRRLQALIAKHPSWHREATPSDGGATDG